MAAVAALSVVALVGVAFWQVWRSFDGNTAALSATGDVLPPVEARTPYSGIDWQSPLPADTSADTSPYAPATEDRDGISNIAGNVAGTLVGSYVELVATGTYTPAEAQKVASNIAANLRANVSSQTYAADDIKTDPDTSYARMLAYRGDMQVALGPLLKNNGYELKLFSSYIDTGDKTYLARLKSAAQNYRDAALNAASVTVPLDAVPHHVAVLNALSEFAATIDTMADHADDAFASAALLQTYTNAEGDILASFNALAAYEKSKTS